MGSITTAIAGIKSDDNASGIAILCELLNPSMKHPKVTKLSLPYNNIDAESGSLLAQTLVNNNSIEYLDISRNIIGTNALGQMIGAIATMPNLKYLSIGDSEDKITDNLADSLIDVLKHHPNLMEVDLREWRHTISDDKINDIKAFSLINKSRTSQHLDLKGLKMNASIIERIFRDNDFTSLKLDNVSLTDDLLFRICDHLKQPNCALKELSIKNNKNISTRGLLALTHVIKWQTESQNASLEAVDLRGVPIKEEAAQSMLEALKLNPQIKKYQFDGHINEEEINERSANEIRMLMASTTHQRQEIAAQQLSEQSFQDDISSLSRKRRAEEVALLKLGRDGFEDLDKFFLQFSRSLMAEISPHLDDYNRILQDKAFGKTGVDRALDGLEGIARLVDGIELSPLTGTVKVDGISNAMQTAIDSVRSFRKEKRSDEAQNTHNNLMSKSQLSKPIEETIHFIARGVLISYRNQLEKLDPKTTKTVFDEMSKAIIGEMTRNKNYGHISSVLDRAMTALFNGIGHNELLPDGILPSKFKLTTKDPQHDKNWNLYSMIRRCGITAFTCTQDDANPMQQIDMIRSQGGKAFRTGITRIDANFSDRQEEMRNDSKEKYGNRYGSSLHVITTDFYEDYATTKVTQPRPPSSSCIPSRAKIMQQHNGVSL